MPHGLKELQGSLRLCTLSAGTDQGSVRDPVWEEALVQHCLEELPGSLRLCTLSALPQALILTKSPYVIPSCRRPWCSIASRSCKARCGGAPCPQALIKAL